MKNQIIKSVKYGLKIYPILLFALSLAFRLGWAQGGQLHENIADSWIELITDYWKPIFFFSAILDFFMMYIHFRTKGTMRYENGKEI